MQSLLPEVTIFARDNVAENVKMFRETVFAVRRWPELPSAISMIGYLAHCSTIWNYLVMVTEISLTAFPEA